MPPTNLYPIVEQELKRMGFVPDKAALTIRYGKHLHPWRLGDYEFLFGKHNTKYIAAAGDQENVGVCLIETYEEWEAFKYHNFPSKKARTDDAQPVQASLEDGAAYQPVPEQAQAIHADGSADKGYETESDKDEDGSSTGAGAQQEPVHVAQSVSVVGDLQMITAIPIVQGEIVQLVQGFIVHTEAAIACRPVLGSAGAGVSIDSAGPSRGAIVAVPPARTTQDVVIVLDD